ncbi:MAG: glycosyltransferase [Acidimicrobiales bacterium]
MTSSSTPAPDLSIVIPAYNERDRIVPTIASTVSYLHTMPWTWELIVSDDGSGDGTPDLVEALTLDGVRVVRGPRNQGKGAAVRRGVRAATGWAVLVTDADMSTPIREVAPMMAKLNDRSMVIGSRALSDADVVGKSVLRNLLSAVLHLLVRVVLGLRFADSQCGFKLMTGDVAHELAGEQQIDGFSFDLEWLFLAGRRGIEVIEHPVEWFDAPGSKVNPLRDSLRFLRDIVEVRLERRAAAHAGAGPDPWDEAADAGSRPLHVGVVTSLPPSTRTLNEYGFHLVNALRSQVEIGSITVFHEDMDGPVPVEDGVHPVAAWRPEAWSNPIRLVRAARRAGVDVVMFNLQFATFGDRRIPAALGLFTPALMRLAGLRTVVLLHNLVDTVDLRSAGFTGSRVRLGAYSLIGRALTHLILQADKVAVTLPGYVDLLKERYGADNVYLAPHGTFPHPELDLAPTSSARSILTFGKFGTYKRVEELIDAFVLLRQAGYEDLELVIAGTSAANSPGYLEQVQAGLDPDLPVRFTGYVAEDDVPELFERSTMVVFPYSSTTGSSGPLHSAGGAGRPAVLPAIGDFVAVIEEEGFTGELFEPGDPMSLAAAMAHLLDDPEYAAELGEHNRRAAGSLDIGLIAGWHALHLAEVAARR